MWVGDLILVLRAPALQSVHVAAHARRQRVLCRRAQTVLEISIVGLTWNFWRSAATTRAHSFFLNLAGRTAAAEAEGEGER